MFFWSFRVVLASFRAKNIDKAGNNKPPAGDLVRLSFVNKNRKFRLEIQLVQLIPQERFRKRWNSSSFPGLTEKTGKILYHL